jgi:hypothetical protein
VARLSSDGMTTLVTTHDQCPSTSARVARSLLPVRSSE